MGYGTTLERHTNFVDFDTDEDLSKFTYTQIASGTCAIIDTNGASRCGIALFSSVDGTENKGATIQWDAESVQLATGKDLEYTARFELSASGQSDCIHGVAIGGSTDPITTPPTYGAYFAVEDGGGGNLVFIVRDNNVTTTRIAVATLVDATRITAGFRIYNITAGSAGNVEIKINGAVVSSTLVAGLPTSEALAPIDAFLSGAAAIQTMSLDYIDWSELR